MTDLLGSTGIVGSTPSATVGPYLAIGLTWADGADVVTAGHPDTITISGTVRDGNGDVVPDGLIESWQADPDGRFDHPDDPRGAVRYPGFRGFGRCATDADGRFTLRTLKPGALPAEAGRLQAPHLDVSVFARGMLNRVVTRIYFPDEAEANQADPVLQSLSEADRRLLIATPDIETPDIETPDVETLDIATLDVETRDVETPDIETPGIDRALRFDIRLQGDGETPFFSV